MLNRQNRRCLPVILLCIAVLPGNTLFAATAIGELAGKFSPSFDFHAEAVVVVREEDTEEQLALTLFSSAEKNNYLAIIKTPGQRTGISLLKKGAQASLYYPESDTFIDLAGKELENPALPFLYILYNPHFLAAYTLKAEKEDTLGIHACTLLELEADTAETAWPYIRLWITGKEALLLKAEYLNPAEARKAEIACLEYAQADNSFIPVKWKVTAALPAPVELSVEIRTAVKTALPDFIFTGAYLQFLCGH